MAPFIPSAGGPSEENDDVLLDLVSSDEEQEQTPQRPSPNVLPVSARSRFAASTALYNDCGNVNDVDDEDDDDDDDEHVVAVDSGKPGLTELAALPDRRPSAIDLTVTPENELPMSSVHPFSSAGSASACEAARLKPVVVDAALIPCASLVPSPNVPDDDDDDDDDDENTFVPVKGPVRRKPVEGPLACPDQTTLGAAKAAAENLAKAQTNTLRSISSKPEPVGTGRSNDDDDADDDELLAPVIGTARRGKREDRVTPGLPVASSFERANPGPTATPPSGGASLLSDRITSLVAAPSTARPRTPPVPIPSDEQLFAGASAVEEREDSYADVSHGAMLEELVPDLNSAKHATFPDPLFSRDYHDTGASPVSSSELQALLSSNNKTADAMEEMDAPPELSVPLMTHQRQALRWMVNRELSEKEAAEPHGGILADDQGFGKTLSTIALMLQNKPPLNESGERPPWGTLIVCPVSLLTQWEQELHDRIDPSYRPKVLIYHGAGRPKNPYVLVNYDVVLTTSGTLVGEYPRLEEVLAPSGTGTIKRRRKKGPLYKVNFFRVILDEAHSIKNRRSEAFAAAFELKAERRWCLTGTPIQNSVDDIYSLFVFLRYIIVTSYKEWKVRWKKSMENRNPATRDRVFKRFQVVLGVILLRRTKNDKIHGKPVISLPQRTVDVLDLSFGADELHFYQQLERQTVADLSKFASDAGKLPDYMAFLLLLLRLRQACNHPSLCQWSKNAGFVFSDDELEKADRDLKSSRGGSLSLLAAPVRDRLMKELSPTCDTGHACPVCMDLIAGEDGVVTRCGHIFCVADYSQWTALNDSCPSCRERIDNVSDFISLTQLRLEVHALVRRKEREDKGKILERVPSVVKKNAIDLSSMSGGKRKRELDISPIAKREKKEDTMCGTSASGSQTSSGVQGSNSGSSADAADEKVEPSKVKPATKENKRQFVQSAKIKALLAHIDTMINSGDDKALVFSQWTRMLDLVEIPLREKGIKVERLDGSMNASQRTAAITSFKKRSDIRLFLISLKAGGCGLNLVEANRVFILDSWWNPAVEDQAIDRCHRIGQRKDVRVYRFKIRNSVEERIFELQEKKRMLMEGALGVEGLQTMGRRRVALAELANIFRDVADHAAETAEHLDDRRAVQHAHGILASIRQQTRR